MAPSILLVFEKPDAGDYEKKRKWDACTKRILHTSSTNKEIQVLGENVLLIPLTKGLDIFGEVLCPKVSFYLDYKYLILSEEIQWHIVSREA